MLVACNSLCGHVRLRFCLASTRPPRLSASYLSVVRLVDRFEQKFLEIVLGSQKVSDAIRLTFIFVLVLLQSRVFCPENRESSVNPFNP
jgi:hypothetical protein